MSNWPYRYFVVVPDAAKNAANGLSDALDPDVGGGDAFCMPLTSDGETITHWATSTLATESIRAGLTAHVGNVPGALWWRMDAASGALQATNAEISEARIGQVFAFSQALADAGLILAQEE